MEEYKESGIDWIGKIPQNWEIKRIKYIYNLQTGFTPDTSNIEYYDDENGFTWVSIADMDKKYISTSKTKISKLYVEEKHPKKVKKGSLLYSFKLSVGKTAFNNTDIYTNEAIASFLNEQDVCLDYLYYASYLIEYNANTNIYGAKILNQNLINNALIINPPLDEQKIIAKFLDDKISKIDFVIESLNKQINILEKYKKSIITNKIVTTFEELQNNGDNKYFNKVPKDYIKRFKDFFVTNTGLNITKENLIENGLNVLSYGQIHSKSNKTTYISKDLIRFVDFKYATNLKSKVNIGDFIFADTSEDLEGTGNCVLNDNNEQLYAGYHTIIASPKNKEYSKYLAYLFMADCWRSQLREIVNGVKVYSITQQILKNTKIIIPPINKINEITKYLDIECKQIDDMIDNKQQQIGKLEIYKQSIVYEYVTGKKRVKGE